VRPAALAGVLADAISHQEQILVVGQPGIGKTAIIRSVCTDIGADLIVSHPAVADPTDFKGFPARDGDHATFLPFGDTWYAITSTRPTVWFVDDLGQASESVQKGLMQLLLGRRINGHVLPEQVTFVGATNDARQQAGVTGLIEPVKSRWDSIVRLETHIDDWSEWALGPGNMPAVLVAFLRDRPELLSAFTPTRDLTNSPCPRTWASVGRRLARGVRDFELIAGAVGQGAATELIGYLELADSAPSIDAALLDPDGTAVPEKPSLRYLMATGLGARMDAQSIDSALRYLGRMPQPFRVLAVRDALRRDKSIARSAGFIRWASAEGKEIL